MTAETLPPGSEYCRALQWASGIVGRRLVVAGSLPATSSTVLGLRDDAGAGWVLRLFTNQEWLAREPDLARHEAAALRRAAALPFPVPQLLDFDAAGTKTGVPAVLMRKLAGDVALPATPDRAWLRVLAEIPLQVAALDVTGFGWSYDPWLAEPADVPSGAAWERAAAVVAGGPPAAPRGFLHRDHHPMNVLWSDGAISGVVDWVNACAGPLPVDLAHCRVNVAAMYGVDAAEVLRQEWERLSADAYDPMWDLFTLLSMVPLEAYPPWATAGLVVSQADVELRLGNLLRHSLAEIGG